LLVEAKYGVRFEVALRTVSKRFCRGYCSVVDSFSWCICL